MEKDKESKKRLRRKEMEQWKKTRKAKKDIEERKWNNGKRQGKPKKIDERKWNNGKRQGKQKKIKKKGNGTMEKDKESKTR